MPSKDYYEVLNTVRAFHEAKKLYTGRFIRFYVGSIKKLIDELDCKTMLDYGCGKGHQWVEPYDPKKGFYNPERMPDVEPFGQPLDQYLNVQVTKYDPGVKEFERQPQGKFDIVVATQVIGAIAQADMQWAVDHMFSLANKAVLIGERGDGGNTKKRFFDKVKHLLIHDWTYEDYANLLRVAGTKYTKIQGWFDWRLRPDAGRSRLERIT